MTAVRSAAVPARSRARTTAIALLAGYAAIVLVVLLSPVSPEAVVRALTSWVRDGLGLEVVRQGWVEFASNIAFFVPLGALLTLAFRRAWLGFVVAIAVSGGAELAQTLLPGRMASPRDVLANVLGAMIGAAIVATMLAVRRHRSSRQMADLS